MTRCHSVRQLMGYICAIFTILLVHHTNVFAQTNDTIQTRVAANVAGTPITVARVDAHIKKTFGSRKIPPNSMAVIQAGALDHLINRRIVYHYLDENRFSPSSGEIDLELEKFEAEVQRVEKTLAQHLQETNQSKDQLVFEISWRLAWKKYLDRFLTDENLEKHFNENRRRFDGTSLKVAHLLLKPKDGRDEPNLATDLRKQLDKDPKSWDDLLQKHSDAPSRSTGGVIGWIQIDGPMPDTFSQAAFQLNTGQISPPVATAFGVHLIKCLEVKTGSLGWKDAKNDVRRDAISFLFDRLVSIQASKVRVEFEADYPHFENGKLVLPPKDSDD